METADRLSRDEIIAHVHQNWADLINLIQSFTEEELEIPDVIGIWSMKDLIGHLETWDRIAIRKLEYAEQGRIEPWWNVEQQPFDSIDAFNEADADANRHKSISALWSELEATHSDLLQRLETSPALTDEVVREDTYEHYADHFNDILAWRSRQSTVAQRDSSA